MKKQISGLLMTLLACTLIFAACSNSETSPPEPVIPGLVNTLAVQTLAARGISPLISTPKPTISSQSTPEAAPERQEFPTQTPLSPLPAAAVPFGASGANLLIPTAGKCFDTAEFIKDISIPDNTPLKPGERFTKIWQVRNIGTCAWTPDYALVHVWGTAMDGVSPSPLIQLIEPGQAVDIAIDLVAPLVPGVYQGNWMFQDDNGERFGTGYNAREQIWVSIISGSPSKKSNGSNDGLFGFLRGGGGC